MKQIIKKIISVTLNSDLISTVRHRLSKIGLNQGTFINGFIHFIANNGILPFKKLTKKEEETASKLATIDALQIGECEYDKKKTIQKTVNQDAYNSAMIVLKKLKMNLAQAIRMLYEKFVLSGEMPYQFVMNYSKLEA